MLWRIVRWFTIPTAAEPQSRSRSLVDNKDCLMLPLRPTWCRSSFQTDVLSTVAYWQADRPVELDLVAAGLTGEYVLTKLEECCFAFRRRLAILEAPIDDIALQGSLER